MDHNLHSSDDLYFYTTLLFGVVVLIYVASKLVPFFAVIFGIQLRKESKHGLLSFRVHSSDIDSVLFGELWILRKAYWPADTIEHYRDFVKNSDATFVIFRDSADGSVRGCFCEQVRTLDVDGQVFHFLYFGNLFTYTYFRGAHYIGLEVTKSILRHYFSAPRHSKCIFVFGAISYKIYLVTARMYPHQFYPSRFTYGNPKFDHLKKAVSTFMGSLYPEYWDEKSFLIRLKGSLFDAANIHDDMLKDPDIKFFNDLNPDYSHGSAIACAFEINLSSILLTVYKLVLRTLKLDQGAKNVQRKNLSRTASKKFTKQQDLEKVVKISLTQRDIARTYVLPRETDLSRTFQLSDKLSLANSDILRNSSDGNQANDTSSSPKTGTGQNWFQKTRTVGSAELKEFQQQVEQEIQKQNDKKKKLKTSVLEFGKSKKH